MSDKCRIKQPFVEFLGQVPWDFFFRFSVFFLEVLNFFPISVDFRNIVEFRKFEI